MRSQQSNHPTIVPREGAEELVKLQATALEAAANAIIITDHAGTIIWVNSAFQQLTGYTSEEITGQSTRLLKSGQQSPSFYQNLWETILAGRIWHGELVNRRKDGSLYHEQMTITPVRNERGVISHFIAIKLDITERKRAEERICRLAQAVENSNELVVMGDLEGWINFVNRAFLKAHGGEEEEILGKHLSDLLSAKNPAGLYEEIRLQTQSGGWRGELFHLRKDGSEFPVFLSTGLIKDAEGQVIGQFGIAQDITDRKSTEEAWRQSEERTRLLLNSTAEAIYGLNLKGECTFSNPASLRLLGYTEPRELLGKNMHALIHHSRPDGTPFPQGECKIFEAFRQGKAIHVSDEVLWRADGTSFPAEYWSHPVRRKDELVGAVVTFLDITERRQLEAQFRGAQKMEAVGRLAGGIAHDFNNLLGVIIGYSELLIEQLGAGGHVRHVEEIRNAGMRAASLTRQLLAFSRQQVLEPKVLDLNASVAEMEKLLRRVIGEDIELITISGPELGRVKADPGQIEQVVINLAVNSRDAMPHGGKLVIETANAELDEAYARRHPPLVPGRFVMLGVSDTGTGMEAETQAHIFEPFFTTKEVGKGTGLGLATVYGIVKQSGGYIWVYSELGKGTTFKIYLPRVEESVDAAGASKALEGPLRGSETVLVVEDAEPLRRLARELLESSGYAVLEAANGAEAIQVAEQHQGPIHLLLTDVVMPVMSGPELAKHLVAADPSTKVIYMTGYTDDAIVHHSVLEAGVALLPKPFTREAVARKVREVLGKG
jgi:PAS domain S-box-containing protein